MLYFNWLQAQMAERVGLSETIPGFGPAGALRATKFAPGEFVEPTEGYKPSLVFKSADPHICATSTRINTKITSTYKKPKSVVMRQSVSVKSRPRKAGQVSVYLISSEAHRELPLQVATSPHASSAFCEAEPG